MTYLTIFGKTIYGWKATAALIAIIYAAVGIVLAIAWRVA